jgi:DNA-binding NarL/FixJ family response regulator
MQRLRLVIANDHQLFTDELRLLLAVEDDIEFVSAVTNGRAAIDACTVEHPDVALVDVDLPDMDGVAATSAIVANAPGTNVVVVSAQSTPEVIARAIEAGAVGFVHKQQAADELVRIVRSAANGDASVRSEDVVEVMPPEERSPHRASSRTGLSAREIDVLQGLADGLSTRELARRLFVSPRTIQGHVQNILTKLQARSKLEAVLRGLRLGLVRLASSRKRTG